MKHRVIVRDEAEADIAEAAVRYESQRLDLGLEFLEKVDLAISQAAENPFRFPRFRKNPEVRRILTEQFPYCVFFIRRGLEIIVFRVLHGARRESEWKNSIPPPQ